MNDEAGPTTWVGQLQHGDPAAAQRLWEAYFERLVGLARRKLAGAPRRAADEEDVALAAFHSFYRGVQQRKFPRLNDRDDLWQVLVVLTARKAIDQRVHDHRQKRGGGAVRGESVFDADKGAGIQQVVGTEPSPEFAAEVAEEFVRLLHALREEDLRKIALAKFEGLTNEEIATRQNCSLRSVERKLALIREIWKDEL